MQYRATLMLTALAFAPSVSAAPLLQNETEMHIEARGSVVADYAIFTNTFTVSDRGKVACETKRTQFIATMKATLVGSGLPTNVATIAFSPCEQPAEPMGAPPYGFSNEAVVVSLPVSGRPVDGDARTSALAASKEADHKPAPLPIFGTNVGITARVDDLSKVPKLQASLGMWMGSRTATSEYHYNNPTEIHARAYADALAKARKEADLLAHALGAHVVRMTRVSNHEAPLSLGDAISLLGAMGPGGGGGKEASWMIPATHSVSVAIDYVISPD